MTNSEQVLERFTAPTREWFTSSFADATPAQIGAWDATSSGDHALVVAPTGSGKTLAAFLWALDSFGARPSTGRTRVVYISPLKALGVDVERNLRAPLVGIGRAAERLSATWTPPTVGVRSGDSTPQQRRQLLSSPPDILITTPESLYLMLTSRAADTLSEVETVIVDEVHAVAGSKRGAHLALTLERLDALLPRPAQRIGLSATVEPHTEVARFLGGGQPVRVVAPPSTKTWELTVTVPVPDMTALPATEQAGEAGPESNASIWPHIENSLVDLLEQNRSTIIFVNARRAAERLTARLNEVHAERQGVEVTPMKGQPSGMIGSMSEGVNRGAPTDLARAHHGSVSKEQRAAIEDDLKSGRLRCVVATSSLELGIDMGLVDLVVQVESPPSVSSGLQRVGRAGHQVGASSRGVFFPKHRADVLSSAIVVTQMRAGAIEPLAIPTNPLDILAQQTVAAAAVADLDVEEWFDIVRRAAPFASLPRSAYEATLDLLAGKYPSAEFAELRPRITWDRTTGTLHGRPGAQRLAVTSGGTIPDRGLFGVYIVGEGDGRRVGELDEEMVYESRVSDVIALGATSWRIEEITHDRVLVTPAYGQPARLPFWVGDNLGRPIALGRALGAFQRSLVGDADAAARLAGVGLDSNAVANTLAYINEQQASTGAVPSDVELVLERFTDELGDWRVVLHSPYGLAVNAPWALAVGVRLRERYGIDGAVMAADDGIVARVPMVDDEPPAAELFLFDPDELVDLVTTEVGSSALFASRFRECAARALLLPRRDPGKRSPLWQQRLRAGQLLEVARDYPSFPIILETVRECLQDVYDLPALRGVASDLAGRRVRLVEVTTPAPSPFARTLLFGYVAQYMYSGDAPLAERRAAALSLDLTLLSELLGRADLRELLDADVIDQTVAELQRLAHDRRASGAEGVADLLRVLGPLTVEEITARLTDPDPADWEELLRTGRAMEVTIAGSRQIAAIEDAGRLRDGLGVPLPVGVPEAFTEPAADPIAELVGRYARTHGPFTTAEVAARFGIGAAVARQTLERLASARRVVAGEFTPGAAEAQWCDAEVLRRLRQRSLAVLRSQIEPVPGAAYARFLVEWQQVGARLRGIDGLAQVLEQLAGVPAPASAWESFILPARVVDYSPALLDELLASGDFIYSGAGTDSAEGWISFHVAADAPLTLAREEDFEPTDSQRALMEQLVGGRFLRELVAASEASLTGDLWALVSAGRVTNDTFAPVRALLGQTKTAHRRPSIPRARTARVGRVRPSAATLPGGRWSLLPDPADDATTVAHARAEYLLDRHGIVTRGAVGAEGHPGGFSVAYKILSRMEERGQTRRGYFIEHLGAAQFGLPPTIDHLRGLADRDAKSHSVVALAATDPANAYGAALPWPDSPTSHRPGRKAGAIVVLVDGELALYVERGGRTALAFDALRLATTEVAAAFVAALRTARVPKLAIEQLNGEPIVGTELADALLAAGCYSSPRAIRFRS